MVTLESFRLLNPKICRLERGSGGVPEITFQEVADCLAKMSPAAATWARMKYGLQGTYSVKVQRHIERRLIEDGEGKDGVLNTYWAGVVQLAIICGLQEKSLTNRSKAQAVGLRWWTKNNERHLSKCLFFLDELDYEVRATVNAWNRGDL